MAEGKVASGARAAQRSTKGKTDAAITADAAVQTRTARSHAAAKGDIVINVTAAPPKSAQHAPSAEQKNVQRYKRRWKAELVRDIIIAIISGIVTFSVSLLLLFFK